MRSKQILLTYLMTKKYDEMFVKFSSTTKYCLLKAAKSKLHFIITNHKTKCKLKPSANLTRKIYNHKML